RSPYALANAPQAIRGGRDGVSRPDGAMSAKFGSASPGAGRREVSSGGAAPTLERPAPPLKVVLFLGFGLTVGIWAFAGVYFGGRIASLDARTTEVSERYVHGQSLLTEARIQVLLASARLRDTL